jgi:2'-5' RNA ligase
VSTPQSPIFHFWALLPDASVSAAILKRKERVHALVGDQLYLTDPPHTTVWLAAMQADSDDAVVAATAEAMVAVESVGSGSITGWHVFDADPLTGNTTMVCQLDENLLARLKGLQMQLVQGLAPRRDEVACHSRYAERFESLPVNAQDSIRSYGFPFVGAHWHPHVTIASIRAGDWPAVWSDLENSCPSGPISYPLLGCFRLDGNEPVELARFPVGQP